MNNWVTAYIDETGTNHLQSEKPGQSHLFICVAVLIADTDLSEVETSMHHISQELCGGAEISSKRVGSDHGRRIRFLEQLQALPFTYVALVINKDRIYRDSGLQHKPSFYKFVNRMLYSRLKNYSQHLRVVADEIGGKDFMDGFRSYLERHGMPNLFSNFEHSFANSSTTRPIQLSDFIAGTLGYCLIPERKGQHSAEFRRLLQPKECGIDAWPPDQILDYVPAEDAARKYGLDETLKARVARFLRDHTDSPDEERQMQATTLSHLLFTRSFEDRDQQAIVSDVLIERLASLGFERLGKQQFQSRVIGKIRDDGIILAGTSDGYRLALTIEDIRDYMDHDRTIVEPMISRLLKARESVKADTKGVLDILQLPQYERLRSVAEAYRDARVELGASRMTAGSDASVPIEPHS